MTEESSQRKLFLSAEKVNVQVQTTASGTLSYARTEPMRSVLSAPDEGRPADHESPLARGLPHPLDGGHGLPPAVHRVGVVVRASEVLRVHADRLQNHAEGAGNVYTGKCT